MTVSYQGNVTLGAAVPGASAAAAQLSASASLQLPDVQARVTGLASLLVRPPANPLAQIAQLQDMIAALLTLANPPALPQVDAIAASLAEVTALLVQIQATLSFANALTSQLATPGIHFYAFEGRANALGNELGAHLSAGLPGGGGPSETIAGFVLLANDGGAIAALRAVMG